MGFISSTPLSFKRTTSNSKCINHRPRIIQTPRAQDVTVDPSPPSDGRNNKWTNKTWNKRATEGTAETIEFTIHPGGIVEEVVSGVRGTVCEKLTEDIEEALGTIITKEKTSEYFHVKENVVENISESASSDDSKKWSKW